MIPHDSSLFRTIPHKLGGKGVKTYLKKNFSTDFDFKVSKRMTCQLKFNLKVLLIRPTLQFILIFIKKNSETFVFLGWLYWGRWLGILPRAVGAGFTGKSDQDCRKGKHTLPDFQFIHSSGPVPKHMNFLDPPPNHINFVYWLIFVVY